MGFKEFVKARPLRARQNSSTNAAELTLRQSIFPIVLVTILFFLWGFSYGTVKAPFSYALPQLTDGTFFLGRGRH